jgi:hypothetical protein
MKLRAAIAAIPMAALITGATPAPQYIPLGDYDESMVVPANSPVTFRHFGKHHDSAYFSGRFVLEGVFILDCDYCEPGYKDNQLRLIIVPDPAIAARLPHWKRHDNDIAIFITDARPFIDAISTSAERTALLSGKLVEVRGRAAIVVDRYEADLECDSADYSAHFVAIAKPPELAEVELKGDFGCGMI